MNKDFEIYKNIKDKCLKREGIFIGEGHFIVKRMIETGQEILSILCVPENYEEYKTLADGRFPVYSLETGEFHLLAGFKFHRGVMGAAKRPSFSSLEKFLKENPEASRLAVLPEIREIENMGSLIRSAAAFGLNALVVGPGCCDPYSRKGIRCSMGNLFSVTLIPYEWDGAAIARLKEGGFSLTGTALTEKAVEIRNFRASSKNAIVLGNEAEGLPEVWQNACDSIVKIPIHKGIDSLNVGVAGGIFFYELSKNNL